MPLSFKLAAAGSLFLLFACSPATDPLYRDGLWQPSHVNHENLAQMVANPSDLVRGTGTTGADGQIASAAVDRLRNDKVKKLPAADIAAIAAGNSGENNSGSSGAQ